MAHGHSFQYCDFVPDHMFSPSHKSLIDNFCSVVSPRVDVHALLDHRVAAGTQCLARFVSAWLHLRRVLCPRSSIRGHFGGGFGTRMRRCEAWP